jgi:hypothetical protein
MLGSGVEHLPGVRDEGVDRTHQDGRAAAGLQGGRGMLERGGDAAHIHGHHPVPFGEVERFGLAPARHQAGVGHDDIEPAVPVRDGSHRLLGRRLVADIAGDEFKAGWQLHLLAEFGKVDDASLGAAGRKA